MTTRAIELHISCKRFWRAWVAWSPSAAAYNLRRRFPKCTSIKISETPPQNKASLESSMWEQHVEESTARVLLTWTQMISPLSHVGRLPNPTRTTMQMTGWKCTWERNKQPGYWTTDALARRCSENKGKKAANEANCTHVLEDVTRRKLRRVQGALW